MGGIMKKEYWKPVVGYEGHYQVSNWGRVKSFDRWVKSRNGSVRFCKGRILKPVTNDRGYLCVELWKNNKRKSCKVHRLVAEAFIPNPYNLPMINHRDEDKTNNRVENLEWCDAKYNSNYGTRNERLSKSVLQYDLEGNFIKEWKSTAECGRNGYNYGNVAACCLGKQKTHKGFIWKYK